MDDHLATLADSDALSIHAGFPNPAADRLGQGAKLALDLNQLLLKSLSSSFLFRISGHAWQAQGIFDNDVAIIDRGPSPHPRDLVIAWEEGGFIISRAADLKRGVSPWGLVTAIIHNFH